MDSPTELTTSVSLRADQFGASKCWIYSFGRYEDFRTAYTQEADKSR